MAFNTNNLPAEYIASSGQTEFPFLFKVFKNTDLLVYKTNNGQVADDSTDLLTLGVQYTVSIMGDTGGSVTLLTAQSLGDRITIIRNLSITRDTEYQNNGDLLSSTLNEDQDYQTYLLGDTNRQLLKALRFSSSSQGLNGVLPSPLPEQYIRWNSSGTTLENDTELPSFVQLAKDWANKAEDEIVADLEYSSKHYSIKSEAQAGIATTQANLAISAFDSFDDRYLGAKASAPTLDNDGNALLTGALYYDSTSSKMNVYTGSVWKEASSAVQGIQANQVYTATTSQTVFNIDYDVGFVSVYVNGLRLSPSDFIATNGTSVVLAVGATLGDTVECQAFGTFELANVYTKAEADSLLDSKASKTGDETLTGVKTFTSSPIVPTPTTATQAVNKDYVDVLVALSSTVIEQTTTPILGLLWNSTDDVYKRIGKNINTLTIDGFNEFTAWKSVTAERQNDSDTVSASPLTAWLDTSANLPYSGMKRYVISNTGTEVKAYNADTYAHADQTGVTATQQVMVKIPQFHYIQAKIVDGGKTYHLYAVAKASFTLNALTELGFTTPTITVWNPTAGVSSGTVASNVISSALHPAFTTHAGATLNQRYYGAFNAVSGRSICGSTIKPTGTITLATARTSCQGFGTGFTQLDFFLESAKNILTLIERGSNYLERGGTSLGNKWEGYSWNTGAGSYDQDNGLTLPLLNKTGVILDGSNRTIANSYRGIENYHSALWRWVDGVSLSANVVYLAKPKATFTDGTITTPYFSSGYTVPSGANASYIADFGAGSFIPTVLGGSASTKVTDGAWTGSTALFVGGALVYASSSGLQAWNSSNAAPAASWNLVSRSGF